MNIVRTLYARVPVAKTGRSRSLKFVITFDEYNVVDTIEQVEVDGKRKTLVSTNKYAAAILRNADKVLGGAIAPVGFTWS